MSDQDKPSGKMSPVEMSMALDEYERQQGFLIRKAQIDAPMLKARYDALILAGFNEQQALVIVAHQPL